MTRKHSLNYLNYLQFIEVIFIAQNKVSVLIISLKYLSFIIVRCRVLYMSTKPFVNFSFQVICINFEISFLLWRWIFKSFIQRIVFKSSSISFFNTVHFVNTFWSNIIGHVQIYKRWYLPRRSIALSL